ncbi:MAG TPA: ferric reductase-like transmembrane domain-containing protein [Opitutaceae bacterium]|jgi:sulfoxide reductase heme-binding subunit YedZ|nr:ferric reductase-like transmembrane domain-containing protein [Opitutaceae bacterium]
MDPIKSVRPPPVSFLAKLLRSKALVVTLIVLPGLWPAWPLFRQDPSVLADPLKYILHHFGFIACVLLAVVLTFTPLRVLFPKSGLVQALNRHRRLVGVSAFFYALLHLATHLLYEGGFGILASDVKKPFLLTGLVAFSILLVLAITSLNRAVRWLGGRRWKKLHRLAYLAAALVAYHQAAARKIFPVQVLWIFVPLILLELLRIIRQAMQKRTTAATVATHS